MSVSGSPTNSGRTERLRDSTKRPSFLTRRCNEEGCIPTTPGKRWAKKRWMSRRKDLSLSMPRSCCKSARVRTSESESFLSDS
ncbi:MAG: hypothetical protein CYG60_15800 [Actinobacteria bacterium]|nr:MAG: hypothetical protein CYG60_15800 [Actinomycetota bacterium]